MSFCCCGNQKDDAIIERKQMQLRSLEEKGLKRGATPVLQREEIPVPVYLNVYSLVESNKHLIRLGMGVFHTGVVVYGIEWGYGEAVDNPSASGLFCVPPGNAAGQLYRTIQIGSTTKSPVQVDTLLHRLENEWRSCDYHILHHNCNHFAQAFCDLLTTIEKLQVPSWCNRAARMADRCIPRKLATKIQRKMDKEPPKAKVPPPQTNVREVPNSVIPAKWYLHPKVYQPPRYMRRRSSSTYSNVDHVPPPGYTAWEEVPWNLSTSHSHESVYSVHSANERNGPLFAVEESVTKPSDSHTSRKRKPRTTIVAKTLVERKEGKNGSKPPAKATLPHAPAPVDADTGSAKDGREMPTVVVQAPIAHLSTLSDHTAPPLEASTVHEESAVLSEGSRKSSTLQQPGGQQPPTPATTESRLAELETLEVTEPEKNPSVISQKPMSEHNLDGLSDLLHRERDNNDEEMEEVVVEQREGSQNTMGEVDLHMCPNQAGPVGTFVVAPRGLHGSSKKYEKVDNRTTDVSASTRSGSSSRRSSPDRRAPSQSPPSQDMSLASTAKVEEIHLEQIQTDPPATALGKRITLPPVPSPPSPASGVSVVSAGLRDGDGLLSPTAGVTPRPYHLSPFLPPPVSPASPPHTPTPPKSPAAGAMGRGDAGEESVNTEKQKEDEEDEEGAASPDVGGKESAFPSLFRARAMSAIAVPGYLQEGEALDPMATTTPCVAPSSACMTPVRGAQFTPHTPSIGPRRPMLAYRTQSALVQGNRLHVEAEDSVDQEVETPSKDPHSCDETKANSPVVPPTEEKHS